MKYAAKRIATLLVTMVVVSFLTFLAFDLISGDPAEIILGTEATAEALAALREDMGLNRPLLVRYSDWLLGFVTGDLGISYQYYQPVGELLGGKLAVTLLLSLLSFVIIVAVSIPLGLLAARHGDGVRGAVQTTGNQFLMAVPAFFTGMLISWLFGIVLHWFTPGAFPGLSNNFFVSLKHLLFAAVAIAIPRAAMTVRMLRGVIRTEQQKSYVRTAISRGNGRSAVLKRHVLKNALVPTVTFLAQTMAEIVAGGIVVEQVFGIPGLGRMLVVSISNRDYPVVQAIVVILAFWVVLAGTLADLVNSRIDPRLQLGGDA